MYSMDTNIGNMSDTELYDEVIKAFIASFGYNGDNQHPKVIAIYKKLKEINRLDVYEKAYNNYYTETI